MDEISIFVSMLDDRGLRDWLDSSFPNLLNSGWHGNCMKKAERVKKEPEFPAIKFDMIKERRNDL